MPIPAFQTAFWTDIKKISSIKVHFLFASLLHSIHSIKNEKYIFPTLATFWDPYRKFSIVSVLGREEGYMVKHIPSAEGVPEGEAQGNS